MYNDQKLKTTIKSRNYLIEKNVFKPIHFLLYLNESVVKQLIQKRSVQFRKCVKNLTVKKMI